MVQDVLAGSERVVRVAERQQRRLCLLARGWVLRGAHHVCYSRAASQHAQVELCHTCGNKYTEQNQVLRALRLLS